MSPRVVDWAARRRAVAEAVFRVAVRDGVEQASLRNVALEAGLSVGSVRHYLGSHEDMIAFAVEVLVRSIEQRILSRVRSFADRTDSGSLVEHVLSEVLPLDDRRRHEAVLWLTFAVAARTRPALLPHAERLYDGLRTLCHRVLTMMSEHSDAMPDDLDLTLEAQRLSSLLNGLLVNGVQHPDRMTPELSLSLLRRHIDSLT